MRFLVGHYLDGHQGPASIGKERSVVLVTRLRLVFIGHGLENGAHYEQPWLVPHSVQHPQAPARITLELPQFEHGVSMNIFPNASFSRSA